MKLGHRGTQGSTSVNIMFRWQRTRQSLEQFWSTRKAEQDLLERTEMRMLIWMMGIKRIENIKAEEVGARAGVANIREK